MHRATRALSLRQAQAWSTIPHAGPSNLSRRVLSTIQTSPTIGPFSALRRSNPKPAPSPFVPRPSLPQASNTRDSESVLESDSVEDEVTPGHAGLQAAVEESHAEGTDAVPRDSEYWDERVQSTETEEFTQATADEIGAMTEEFDEDLDPALKPWQKPVIPRDIIPGEPIILPLSSLAAADPTAPVPSGRAISLPPALFGCPVRRDILHACVIWWRASTRLGTHKNLGRGEVAFSGRKLRPQKKTGKARLGSAGSPMLRKGGVAHPKRPRDYSIDLPRKVRAMGTRSALSAKLYMGTLRVVENLNEGDRLKTKDVVRALTAGKRLPAGYAYESDFTSASIEEESSQEYTESSVAAEAVNVDSIGKSTETETANDDTASLWVDSKGFAPTKEDLSVLFLYPPTKPAGEVWDFARPLRNVPGVEVMSTDQVEVYHLLHYRWVVMEGGCVDAFAKHAGQIEAPAPIFPEAQLPTHVKPVKTFQPGVVEKKRPKRVPTFTNMPSDIYWILNGWRKIRGRKSMRKTFGQKNADKYQLIAKRAWKKIRRLGGFATPDRVALEINAGKVGGKRALTAER